MLQKIYVLNGKYLTTVQSHSANPMASSASPLLLNNFPASSSLSCVFTYLPLKASNPPRPRVICSRNRGLSREKKKILRNPNLISSEAPPPSPPQVPYPYSSHNFVYFGWQFDCCQLQGRRGKKGEERRRRGSAVVEEAEERSTHRLLLTPVLEEI